MSMEIRTGDRNFLAAMRENRSMVTELQSERQKLQDKLFLAKTSGTDSIGVPKEKQKEMEDKVKSLSQQLRKARIDYKV